LTLLDIRINQVSEYPSICFLNVIPLMAVSLSVPQKCFPIGMAVRQLVGFIERQSFLDYRRFHRTLTSTGLYIDDYQRTKIYDKLYWNTNKPPLNTDNEKPTKHSSYERNSADSINGKQIYFIYM